METFTEARSCRAHRLPACSSIFSLPLTAACRQASRVLPESSPLLRVSQGCRSTCRQMQREESRSESSINKRTGYAFVDSQRILATSTRCQRQRFIVCGLTLSRCSSCPAQVATSPSRCSVSELTFAFVCLPPLNCLDGCNYCVSILERAGTTFIL